MEKRLVNLITIIVNFFGTIYRKAKLLFTLILNTKYYKSKSYYPNRRKKSTIRVFIEQVFFVLKNTEINEYYFAFGFDGKTQTEIKSYMPYGKFAHKRDFMNSKPIGSKSAKFPHDYLVILRDKFLFGQYIKSLSFSTPTNFAFINNGKVKLLDKRFNITIDDLLDYELDVFCKTIDGFGGDDIFPLRIENKIVYIKGVKSSIDEFKSKINNSPYILQNRLKQHETLAKIYNKSINTIRLTTIYNERTMEVDFFGAALTIGLWVVLLLE